MAPAADAGAPATLRYTETLGPQTVLHLDREGRELTAVLEGLKALKEPCAVELFSDSQYIVNALNNGWLRDWKRRGWKRRDGELKNPELWQELDGLLQTHTVSAHWVKGHADNEYNNRCDALAVAERDKFAPEIGL